jgi:hypothetical protein
LSVIFENLFENIFEKNFNDKKQSDRVLTLIIIIQIDRVLAIEADSIFFPKQNKNLVILNEENFAVLPIIGFRIFKKLNS